MKTTREFLAYLKSLDVQFWVNGDKLRYSAPTGTLTPTLLGQIKEYKAEIIQLLQNTDINSSSSNGAIVPIPRDTDIPLSFAQQRLWLIEQIEGKSAIYNESAVVKISGSLQIAVLKQSFAEIVQRHEVLRTSFKNVDGQAIQAIAPNLTITVPVVDWRSLTKTEQEQEVPRLIAEEAKRPFDLTQTPLLRVTLLQLEETEYLLQLTIHHILADFWAIILLLDEFTLLYQAFAQGKASPLPPLPIQYADFTVWQRQYLQTGIIEKELAYWKQQLHNAPKLLQLPTERSRPPIQTYPGQIHIFSLSKTLTESLKATSRSAGATLFMTLLATFKTLLYRYTGQEDILLGSPIANRNRVEIEKLIGFFVNTLVLRTSLSGNPSFRELLTRVREVTLNAYAHQNLPFEKLVEELQQPRDLSYSQLFQVMFSFLNTPQTSLEIPGLTLEVVPTHNQTSKFDLSLEFAQTESGLIGEIEYNTDLFDAATISRMSGHLQTLLTAVAANPDQRLLELPLLTPKEENQLLIEWNQTQVDYPQQTCIHQLFESQVERTPDAIALVFEDEQLTYQQLNTKANQLAHYLQKLGVKPETLVGICVERSLEMVIGLLGILKAGGAYVPLDPAYPPERLEFMLADAQVPILLTQASRLTTLPTHSAQVICLDTDWDKITLHNQQNPHSIVTSENLIYVIYTSGSTGKPKGTMNTHKGLCNRLLWMQDTYKLTPQDRVLQKTPFSFDVSVWEFFWTLITGAKLVIAQPKGHQDSAYLVQLIAQEQITTVHFVPSMLQVFLEESGLESCSCLKRVICSGEALPKTLQDRFFARLDAELHNLYGPTEAAIDVTFWQCQPHSQLPFVPIGRPIANTQIYILDSQGQPTPVGIPGELHIGGVGLARGYLNLPELTQTKFIPNPFSEELDSRLYKTGDLARYLPNGEIEYISRIDNQIKLRGFRIELGEIETVISQHPQIRETVVAVHSDQADFQRLVAYLVLHSEQDLAISELRQFLELQLPDYMIPNVFVTLEALPLTPNGKVDRQALPAPDPIQLSQKADFVPPSSPVEEILAGIWADVLGLEKVGVHNNFFQLGGHSLIATRVISRIRQVFSQELPLRRLFETPTVAQLAKDIETAAKVGSKLQIPPIKRHSWKKELPLSFAQQRLWFLDQLEPDSPFYNIPMAVRLQGQLHHDALEQSFHTIVQRHKALQTNFQTVAGQPTAVISPTKLINLPILDLSALPTQQRETEIKQLVLAEAQSPFDLNNDLLLRVKLLHIGEQEYILLLTMHHIISDGWSIGVVVREVSQLYTAFCAGQPPTLPELPIQYADFAAWQRQWLKGEVLQEQISYWRKNLEGLPPRLELPTDRPRPPVQRFQGAIHALTISPELTVALNQFSQQTGSTLFMTLLTAFKVLLGRYTNSTDIVVGTPIANRNQGETEQLIGLFANTLVLRTDLSGNPAFRELLSRVREVALGAYAHQDLPFEQLVEELQPLRSLSHTPLFQVMFVLQNAPLSELELAGLTLSAVETELGIAKFDLTLYMEQVDSGLRAAFEYNTDLFDASTISRMAGHLQTLLTAIAANPDQQILELPLLTSTEEEQLLIEWNQTQVNYPQQTCIHQLFESQVERTPDAVALVFEDEQLTYRELNTKANQLAHYLQKLGVKPETLVGICVERSLEMVVGLLGILKAGGAYVPLDPAYPPERLEFMLADAQVPILLTQASLLTTLPTHSAQVICLDTDWDNITLHNQQNPHSIVTSENLIYVIYTSGSTGKPKGVQICHKGVINFLTSMERQLQFTQSDILLAVTSISFDIAVLELYLPLIIGARLVLASRTVATDGKQLSEHLHSANATIMQATPATWRMLLTSGWSGNSQLKILCGGEALTRELAQQLLSKGASLWNLYGPTETTIWSTANEIKTTQKSQAIILIGRPIANTQIYILDSQGQPTPVGIPGELHIGGVGLARGYLNLPELTQTKFIPNPFSEELDSRLYKTGDLARYLPNGEIEYISRIDNQIKLRGFRIELGEIETVISQHPQIRETVVAVHSDQADFQRLVAYLVLHSEQDLAISELRQFLELQLPDYMIPNVFVTLEALPLTPNGKVDRQALPAPDPIQLSQKADFVPPSSPVEEILAGIWADVLGLEKVGVHNNFFQLGGHSLIATRVISRIRQVFSQELPLRRLFETPTVAQLAKDIETAAKVGSKLQIPPIKRHSWKKELPLSFAQQRLWFLDQLEPDSPFYNIPMAVRLQGQLHHDALEQSFHTIVQRHKALQTNFQTVAGQPTAVISPTKLINLPILDLSALPTQQRETEIKQLVLAEAQSPFDLNNDLLLRVKLLHIGEQEYILLLTMHHIISDGWSIGVVVREVSQLYTAFCAGQPPTLPELPIQYADFAAWQRQWLKGEVLQEQISYWRKNLEGLPPRLELPTDRPRPPVQRFQGAIHALTISPELTVALNQFSQQTGSTLFMTLLTAFKVLLGRYTNSTDIVVGTPIANRNQGETEQLIGLFANTLVLRTDLSGNPAFRELLSRVREVALGAYAHQDLPFEQLVEELQPLRSLSHTPLFQVMFVLQNAPLSELELAGLTLSAVETELGIAKFDLTLYMEQVDSGLRAAFEYNTDLFDASTISRMAGHLQTLLTAIAANPDQQILELPLLTSTEEEQLLIEWNQTQVNYPQQTCIHQLFESQVERTPDAVALVFEDEQLTYRELNTKANQLAHYLQKLGVKPETLVGICVERSLEMVIGLLGILKAGGAYVPLDPAYPPERIAFMLADAQVPILLTQTSLLETLPTHSAQVICLDTDWDKITLHNQQNPHSIVTSENLIYVIYTSGSTGKPKGTMNTHKGLCNRLLWMQDTYKLTPQDRVLQKTPFSFDVSVWEFFWPLITGAKLVIAQPGGHQDSAYLVQLIAQEQITTVHFVPSMLQVFLEELGLESCSCLKRVICSGEALAKTLQDRFFARLDAELHNLYGPTEAAIDVTFWQCQPHSQLPFVPIGRPIANTQIYILDSQGKPTPVGVPGELHIGGVGLARGYLNRPDLTKEKFIPHPFSEELDSRLYKTGDLARYLSNGEIEYIGRVDYQVKIRGFRIELGEIESVISQHPDVRESVVIVHSDKADFQRLVAYLVPYSEQELIIAQLRQFLELRLPDYMIPNVFVMLEALPLTPNGKVDRKALPIPDTFLRDSEVVFVPPRTSIEKTLAAIYVDVLRLEKVSIHDNFFALGGHSLLATKVISRLREAFKLELPLRSLFERPTIAGLAERIETMRLALTQVSRSSLIMQPGRKEIEL